jgi:periplasmic divalent cation tolerance protein
VAFLAKTEKDRFPALRDRVLALHSYDTPCVVALPIADGAPDFLSWITANTRG